MLLDQTRYVLINRLVMPAAAFLLLIIIGRHSDLLLGEYALVTTFYFVMQTLPLLGLTPFVMREVSRQPDAAGRYFVTIGLFTVLTGVLVNVATQFMLTFMPYSDAIKSGIGVVGFSIFGGILAFLAEIILISLHRARLVALTTVIENTLRLVISVVALELGAGVVELMWVVFATRLFALSVYVAALTRSHSGKLQADWNILSRMRVVLPVFATSAILFLAISRMDYFILSWFGSAEMMGYYAIAYRLFEIAMLAVAAVTTAIFPRISRQYADDPAGFRHSVRQLALGLTGLLIPIALAGYLFADSYVWLLFNKQYPQPVLLAELFILVLPLAGLDLMCATVLNSADHQTHDLKAMAVGAFIYACALMLLVPQYFGVGALVAFVIATIAQLGARLHFIHRVLGPMLRVTDVVTYLVIAGLLFGWVNGLHRSMGLAGDFIALATLVVAYPALLILTRRLRPLDALGTFWRSGDVGPPDTARGLLDHLAEDVRERKRWLSSYPGGAAQYENLSLLSVSLYRIARYFQLNGSPRIARLFSLVDLFLTKGEVSPNADIGPGLVIVRPAGVGIMGQVGKRVRFDAWSGLGIRGATNAGAGPGVTIVEDDVVFEPRSGALGGMRIPAGTVVARHCVALRPAHLKSNEDSVQ